MSTIYSISRTVVVWLGKENAGSDKAMEAFNKDLEGLANSESADLPNYDHWLQYHSSLTALFAREYWARMWIVQEVLLANCIVFFASTKSLCLGGKVGTFDHAFWYYGKTHQPLGHGFKILEKATSLRPGRPHNSPIGRIFDYLDIWEGQKCHDRRDKVFGLLGLATADTAWLNPDYSRSTKQLLVTIICDFVKHVESPIHWINYMNQLGRILQVDLESEEVREGRRKAVKFMVEKFPDWPFHHDPAYFGHYI
jgi:hypothetical protein